jgi:flagellar protein FliO/FliZ
MSNVSVAALLLRLVLSLGVVIVLMAGLAKLARNRMGRTAGRRRDHALQLQVLSRQTIGKNASVLLVRAGDRGLLLGVTEHNVSLITETELTAAPADESPAPARTTALAPPWNMLVQRARELTVRRA